MPRKINLERVEASLATTWPECGYVIDPSEIRRVTDDMECPKCRAPATFRRLQSRQRSTRRANYDSLDTSSPVAIAY
jgi:ssDNA-binding Zn-finger/Zn-ribbon topoisomerase 1